MLVLSVIDSPRPSTQINHSLTYKELVEYPIDCAKAPEQLTELLTIKKQKNFNQDPDLLNEADYEYNSRLNLTIWWYSYSCDKS